MFSALLSSHFWKAALPALIVTSALFAWVTNLIPALPRPPRPPVTTEELITSSIIIILITLNAGLYMWHKHHASCPVGTRRATGIAGALGALALLCPACTLIPLAILGTSISLAFLSPFLPLLRIVALILLLASLWILRPKPELR